MNEEIKGSRLPVFNNRKERRKNGQRSGYKLSAKLTKKGEKENV